MLKKSSQLLTGLTVFALFVSACGSDDGTATTTAPTTTPSTSEPTDSTPPDAVVLRYDFESGSEGWDADVSDFSDATRPDDVLFEAGAQPPELDTTNGTFHLAASNRSDNTFLYMYRSIGLDDGLAPGTTYQIEFVISAASNAPSNCVGIGGAPGESVWLKVGASIEQPVPVDEDGDIRLSVDKGNQSQGGDAADVAGDIANGIPCEEALDAGSPFAMVTWEHVLSHQVETDDAAELWLFIGTDSGFEGRTDLYYDTVEVTLTPQS